MKNKYNFKAFDLLKNFREEFNLKKMKYTKHSGIKMLVAKVP
tara:strand:+ start:305 stop:430 length:126 start_codon:yes stop_codon:yes gene_type:complete